MRPVRVKITEIITRRLMIVFKQSPEVLWPTMLEELCKRIQHCCATLRWSRNKRNVGSCCLKSFTGYKIWPKTPNKMQQHARTGKRMWKRTQHVTPTMLEVVGQKCWVRLHGGWCHVYDVLFWVPFDEKFYSLRHSLIMHFCVDSELW